MKRMIRLAALALFLSASAVFAAEAAPVTDSLSAAGQGPVDVMQQELALRDSVMQAQGNACSMEKDSLRAVIESEKAKSENWEKSYNTIKKDNEVCAQALGISIGVNEQKNEKAKEDRQQAAMMSGSSFLGGVGIGLLIMWLIMK